MGSSLAQTEQAVIILIDHNGPSYLLAIDKATGKNLWKTDRNRKASWTTPVVTRQDGRPIVLVSGSGSLTGYDAATGKELWSFGGLHGNNIPSPTVAGDLVVVGAGESRFTPDRAASIKSNCCLRLTTQEDKPACEIAWQGKKVISHHASPLIHKDHAYFVTQAGVIHCLDLKTGEERYAERLANSCWATPIGAGDHIYCFGKEGVTTVLKAGSKFEKVATNRLWSDEVAQARRVEDARKPENQLPKRPGSDEQPGYDSLGEVVYGVAVVNDAFFIRTGNVLYGLRQNK
jgi:outer membrane protein assembly factor BamB